jgi:hypothetical protein
LNEELPESEKVYRMDKETQILNISIGPFCYQLVAHDQWGVGTLEKIGRNTHCITPDARPSRVIHIIEFRLTPQEMKDSLSNIIPERLMHMLPCRMPERGWTTVADSCGQRYWFHESTPHTVWNYDPLWDNFKDTVTLPWQAVFMDAVRKRGGIFHGGMVIRDGISYILTAPGGGGKTTAVSRLPPPWKALSDDAALILPSADKGFVVYPLPNWIEVVKRYKNIPDAANCPITSSYQLGGILLLKKADHENLSVIEPLDAVQHIYRALSEQSKVLLIRNLFRKDLFHISSEIARTVPFREMELTRDGNFWDMLKKEFIRD